MPVVEITNLTKDYEVGFWRKRKVRALDGLTLSIDRGQIFGFLGANGAGKTTTLKLLMRLIFPTSGSASILGHDIRDVTMHGRIGYLPENPYFYDYLTAREFLDYCAEIFGYPSATRKLSCRSLYRASIASCSDAATVESPSRCSISCISAFMSRSG